MNKLLLYFSLVCAFHFTVSYNLEKRVTARDFKTPNSLKSSRKHELPSLLLLQDIDLHSISTQYQSESEENGFSVERDCDLRNSSTSGDGECLESLTFRKPDTVNNLTSRGQTLVEVSKRGSTNTLLVCQPQTAQQCMDSEANIGACYVQNFGTTSVNHTHGMQWRKLNPCWQSCYTNVVDLAFVIDGSGSVNVTNFNKVLQWIHDVIQVFNITENYRVAVVKFARRHRTKVEIQLGEYRNHTAFQEGVKKIEYNPGGTESSYAINLTVNSVFKGPYGRFPLARRVMVFLTDGKSSDNKYLESSANFARRNFIESFAVGIANYRMKELLEIAGNPERVFTAENFENLGSTIAKLQEGIRELEGGKKMVHNTSNAGLDMCGVGASTRISKGNGKLYLGAVGAYDWAGNVIKYDTVNDEVADIPKYTDIQGVLPNRTKESYMGYSVTTGFFNGAGYSGAKEFVATGAPRYYLTGAVVIYSTRMNDNKFYDSVTLQNVKKFRQLGSYFGGSLLAVDVNNDNRDDLLVGAPLYVGSKFDEGRVFVYVTSSVSDNLAKWTSESYEPLELYGDHSEGGRFGTAIASAGDLNKDGYNDIIIGAPLTEGDRGAVFVYHGGSNGLQTQAKQKILASELLGVSLKYFGQSLQGGVDLDGNKYPDIAVGAPKSDTVVIFRSRPVVKFEATVNFMTGDIDIFECINKNYINCTSIRVCFKASGMSVEETIGMKYNLTLDSGNNAVPDKRLEFRTKSGISSTGFTTKSSDIQLTKGSKTCFEETVYMRQNVKDYDSTVSAEVKFDLLSSHTSKPLSSVRDPSISNSKSSSIKFAKKCGDDSTCDSDLQVRAQLILPKPTGPTDLTEGRSVLVIDSATANFPVTVKVNLTNSGENAFDTRVRVTYTSQISLSTLLNRVANPPTNSCMVEDTDPVEIGNGLKTQILRYNYRTNIMQQNSWCYFEFNLITDSLRNNGTLETFTVNVTAYTSDSSSMSREKNIADNTWEKTPTIKYRSDFTSTRKGNLADISLNETKANETITSVKQIGQNTSDVTIEFEIGGLGYSNIPTSEISLTWPARNDFEEEFLYLYKIHCSEEVGCSCDQSKINRFNLTLEAPNENNTDGANVTLMKTSNPIDLNTFNCFEKNSSEKSFCETVVCTVPNLGSSDKLIFRASFRVWTPSFVFNGTNITQVTLHSRFEVSTANSPLIVDRNGKNGMVKSEQILSKVKLYKPPVPVTQDDNLWIYILAAIGGLLLLIAIVLILWKVGFFNSKYADMKKDAQDDMNDDTDFQNGNSTADMMD